MRILKEEEEEEEDEEEVRTIHKEKKKKICTRLFHAQHFVCVGHISHQHVRVPSYQVAFEGIEFLQL